MLLECPSAHIKGKYKAFYYKSERNLSEMPLTFNSVAYSNVSDTALLGLYAPIYSEYMIVGFDSITIDFSKNLQDHSFFESIQFSQSSASM